MLIQRLLVRTLTRPFIQQQLLGVRQAHKEAIEGPTKSGLKVPENWQRYLFVAVGLFSYPIYTLYNLDNIRAHYENQTSQTPSKEQKEVYLASFNK